MKLSTFTLLFRLSARLCKLTGAIDRTAGRLHQWAWKRTEHARLADCNTRPATRFN